ncbi:hypothetical protein DPMN_047813 [Dreissena polymorpha]|uniref:Uncharacterized protein n=1 Tax=Dreissena polymorpha TaxID=45954 RepID=A0A9D4DA45_DREPO|nr:hypothetical protein DPMN_047813 [Dreissena polymorpha]
MLPLVPLFQSVPGAICLSSVTILFLVVIQSFLEVTGASRYRISLNTVLRLLLNQHHQHGFRRLRMFRPFTSMNILIAVGPQW